MLSGPTSYVITILALALISSDLPAHSEHSDQPQATTGQASNQDFKVRIPQPGDKPVDKEIYKRKVLNAKLVDQNNRTFTLADLSGQTLLLQFIFTDCQSFCPRQSAELEQVRQNLIRTLQRERITFVTITVAPAIDTPDKLQRFSSRFITNDSHEDKIAWHFVTGQPDTVNLLGTTLGVARTSLGDGQYDHQTTLFLLDSMGNLRQQYRGNPLDRKRLSRDVKALASLIE